MMSPKTPRVIDAIGATGGGAGPNIVIGGRHLHDIIAEL
jgi:hypothetical protein